MSATEAKEFVSEVWGLQGTAYLVLALRYYARVSKSGWNSLAWDDALMFLATVRYPSQRPFSAPFPLLNFSFLQKGEAHNPESSR